MNTIFKELLTLFKFIGGIFEGIKKLIIPTKAYSWQTFIYLSVFSAAMANFTSGYVSNVIALSGWFFLIAGTAWYTNDDPLRVPGTFMPVGAVITGLLVCVFAFGNSDNLFTPVTLIMWPTISGLITAMPEFIEGKDIESEPKIPKPEVRQKIIVLVASCMLISCWIRFYFFLDNWLVQYPSLMTDTFESSTLVTRIAEPEPESTALTSNQGESKSKQKNGVDMIGDIYSYVIGESQGTRERYEIPKNGVDILDILQVQVQQDLKRKPWSLVERWLLDVDNNVNRLGIAAVNQKLGSIAEKEFWQVQYRITNVNFGYKLDLLNIWQGPSSEPQGYYLQKSCRIKPVPIYNGSTELSATSGDNKNIMAEVECDRPSQFIIGAPPPKY